MVLHFENIYEGYITLFSAPLPRHYLEPIPIADQVNGAGFRAEEAPNLPTSGAFKFESVTPQQELRLARNDNYTSPWTGKPAHLDNLIWKWYGDADLMIAGFKANEIDFATDLQDSDIPKVQDLGDQVSAIPALLYEFLRPNWSEGPFDADDQGRWLLAQPDGPGPRRRAARWQTRRCARRSPTRSTRTRSTAGSWAAPSRSPTRTSPPAPGSSRTRPRRRSTRRKAQSILEEAGWVDSDGDGIREKDGLKAKIELCTTTRQVRIDTLALISDWLKDVGIEGVANAVDATAIFADYNEATADTPCGLSVSNFDLAEHAFSSSIDPLGNYFNYHSSQFEPDGANDAQVVDTGIDASLDTVKNSVDFAVIKDAMAEFQKIYVEKTVEIPLYYRKNVELVGPKLGNFFANPTQAGPTWNAVDWFANP